MASKRFCDLCGSLLDWPKYIACHALDSKAKSGDYCLDCWTKQPNWPKIHQIVKDK